MTDNLPPIPADVDELIVYSLDLGTHPASRPGLVLVKSTEPDRHGGMCSPRRYQGTCRRENWRSTLLNAGFTERARLPGVWGRPPAASYSQSSYETPE